MVRTRNRCAVAGALAALLGLAMFSGPGLAQDATPVGTPEQMTGAPGGHPAHIHSGSCDTLGPVVAPLGHVGVVPSDSATPGISGQAMGAQTALPVEQSITQEVPLPLEQILAQPHAINVHLSDQEINTYIACGDIGGTQFGTTFMFGLRELNNSGYTGLALLSPDASGQATNVVIYLVQGAAQS